MVIIINRSVLTRIWLLKGLRTAIHLAWGCCSSRHAVVSIDKWLADSEAIHREFLFDCVGTAIAQDCRRCYNPPTIIDYAAEM